MKTLLDAKHLLETFGYFGLFFVIFAESGLLVGFFLPGDSLLFTAGLFSARVIPGTHTQLNIAVVCVVCAAAAISGDQVGYLFGRRVGPAVFRRPNSRIFKQKYVDKSQAFFDEYGAKTIVLARFVPIVRTFGPILAGVGKMRYRTFITFNVAGGVLWGIGVPLLGHSLGNVEFIANHFEVIAIIIVAISVVPVGIELLRARINRSRKAAREDDDRRTTAPRL